LYSAIRYHDASPLSIPVENFAPAARSTRPIGQLLAESLPLAIAGAAAGCLFSYGEIKGVVALIPDGLIPREEQIRNTQWRNDIIRKRRLTFGG
jgi:hypothetical protein